MSSQWRDQTRSAGLLDVLKWRLLGERPKWPKKQLRPADRVIPAERVNGPISVTYIGHASLLIQACGINVLVDPHFSQLPGLSLSDLPPIDLIFVSHNHYDHLDLPSLSQLWKRHRPQLIAPLGNDRTIPKEMGLQMLDWGQTAVVSEQVSLQLLPCRHWSARTPFDRNRALWGAASLRFGDKLVLFVGDSAFDLQLFEEMRVMIGSPPDLVILPIGAYEPRWFLSEVHMNPEEAWQAFQILGGKQLVPTHYDVFPLADEPFGEAIARLEAAAGPEWNRVLSLAVGQTGHVD